MLSEMLSIENEDVRKHSFLQACYPISGNEGWENISKLGEEGRVDIQSGGICLLKQRLGMMEPCCPRDG